MTFINEIDIESRRHAAYLLAEKLMAYKNKDAIVVAVPYGGAPVGFWLSEQLNLPFYVMPCRSITVSLKGSKSIGSISADDLCVREVHDIPQSYVYHQIQLARTRVAQEHNFFNAIKAQTSLHNKTVIIVDDVLYHSDAIRASLISIRKQQPTKIVVVVPFITDEAMLQISEDVDDVVYLYKSRNPQNIRRLVSAFPKVKPEDVKAMLLGSIKS